MKKMLMTVAVVMFGVMAWAQTKKVDSWDLFAKTKFEPKYHEKLGEYLFYPTFSEEVKNLAGQEITIVGYYVPFAPEDGNYIIISKYPQSQCFFCGGGGPESIAEINFAKDQTKFQIDDLITVRGKLKLNADDLEHINFILTDAVLVSK